MKQIAEPYKKTSTCPFNIERYNIRDNRQDKTGPYLAIQYLSDTMAVQDTVRTGAVRKRGDLRTINW